MLNRLLCWSIGSMAAVVFILFILIGGQVGNGNSGTGLSVLKVFAQQVQSELKPDGIVREENIYICGDVEEVARKTTASLGVESENELREKYATLGFILNFRQSDVLAQRKVNDFCSYHRGFRHLGLHNDKIAVFQGPIGYDQVLLRTEETIQLQSLGADYQVKLQQAANFFQMTPETQAKLRYELEFTNEDALNAILENMDEMQE